MAKKYGFALDKSLADKELGDNFYTGETPPKGNYHGNLKLLAVKKNKNDDDMLNYLIEVHETGDKAKYNGYGIWGNLNVTEQGAAWLNNFLDALGPKAKADFYAGNVTVDGANPPNILKIGSLKPIGVELFASCKIETYNGEGNLRVGTFLIEEGGKKKKGKAEPEPEDDEAEGLEDPDEEEAEDEEAEDDTEADEEEAEDEEDEEAEEEQYTEAELKELDPADLKGILDGWEVEYAPKATKATLIKTILAQYEEADDDEAEDEEEEESDTLTEEDMGEMSPDELKAWIKEKGWKMPKPPVRSKLMKTILESQSEPPF